MEPGTGHLIGVGWQPLVTSPFWPRLSFKNTQLPPCTGPRGSWGIKMLFHRVFFLYIHIWCSQRSISPVTRAGPAEHNTLFFPVLLCLAPLPLLANCILIHVLASALPTQWPPINMSITIWNHQVVMPLDWLYWVRWFEIFICDGCAGRKRVIEWKEAINVWQTDLLGCNQISAYARGRKNQQC